MHWSNRLVTRYWHSSRKVWRSGLSVGREECAGLRERGGVDALLLGQTVGEACRQSGEKVVTIACQDVAVGGGGRGSRISRFSMARGHGIEVGRGGARLKCHGR
jgi:hypothetical protein